MNTYLAVDFGGGSGRVMAGTIDNGRLTLEEVYRFPNRQIRMGNYIYWDFLALFGEMKTGLRLAAHKGYSIKSIGIDTWGVDFGLIDKAICWVIRFAIAIRARMDYPKNCSGIWIFPVIMRRPVFK